MIVDGKGFILTNDHVIDQASKIQVTMDGDSEHYTARLVGTDKDTDLAVIKIEADHVLPTAKLGNSDGVQVGDWVLAFGSPFGLNSTVTAGIVSARDRSNVGHQFQRFVQTDAAINPGNSGRTAREYGRRRDRHQHRDLYGQPRDLKAWDSRCLPTPPSMSTTSW